MMKEEDSKHVIVKEDEDEEEDSNKRETILETLLLEFEFEKLEMLEHLVSKNKKLFLKFNELLLDDCKLLNEIILKKKSNSLLSLVKLGIPHPSQRKKIWRTLIFLTSKQDLQKKKSEQLYEKLLQQKVDSKVNDQILKDVRRTFPKYKFFKLGTGHKQLYNVLHAYSILDKKVGYMQGMCFLVGFLLMHCSEEETFYLFVELMNNEKYDWKGIFEPGLRFLKKLLIWVDVLLELQVPKLFKYFKKIDFIPEMYAVNFICTLFTNYCNFKTCTRIWDLYLCQSWPFIVRLIIGILKFLKKELITLSFIKISPRIHEFCKIMKPKEMVKLYSEIKFNSKTLKVLEEKYLNKLPEDERQKILIQKKMRKSFLNGKENEVGGLGHSNLNKEKSKGFTTRIISLFEQFFNAFKSLDSSVNPEDLFFKKGNSEIEILANTISEEDEREIEERRKRRTARRKLKKEERNFNFDDDEEEVFEEEEEEFIKIEKEIANSCEQSFIDQMSTGVGVGEDLNNFNIQKIIEKDQVYYKNKEIEEERILRGIEEEEKRIIKEIEKRESVRMDLTELKNQVNELKNQIRFNLDDDDNSNNKELEEEENNEQENIIISIEEKYEDVLNIKSFLESNNINDDEENNFENKNIIQEENNIRKV